MKIKIRYVKGIFIVVLFILATSFLICCKKKDCDTIEIGCNEVYLAEVNDYLPAIKINGIDKTWDNFIFANEDDFIYVYKNEIHLTENAPICFSTNLTIIYKQNRNLICELKVNKEPIELQSLSVELLSGVFEGEWVNYRITTYPFNAIHGQYDISFNKPYYIEEIGDGCFKLVENVPYGETISITVTEESEIFATKTFGISKKYKIYTASQLLKINNDIYGYYILQQDIYFNEFIWKTIPSFAGVLDGNNMTITGLTITRDAYSGSGNLYLGLFGALSGKVFNLSIRDSSIYVDPGHDGGGWIYAGLVAGINSGTIDNVKVYSSSVTVHRNKSEIGGLAGDTGGTIQYCHVYGITVYGNGSEGGIAGGATGTIKNCSINGYNETKTTIKHYATSNDARQVGGVIGYSNGASIIECNVYNMEIILADGSDFKKMTCMGYIVGEQKGGTIYHVGKGEGCSYSPNRNSSSLYSGGGFLGIGAYDYRAYYFSQGWGYAGKLTDNPVIE